MRTIRVISAALAAGASLAAMIATPLSTAGAINSGDGDIKMRARLGQDAIHARSSGGKVYLRVDLEGARINPSEDRPSANVAIVIDRSGSMNGDGKIERAREAAIMAINRLSRDDFASIVAYNERVDVLVPATRVDERSEIAGVIERLAAGGRTALYAGTEEGVRQVRRYRAGDRVNRVILLSDGLANVGPVSPSEIERLGRDAARDGISISTIGLGLGYNEDLMSRLAFSSDGNHAFVRNSSDLVRVFDQEFGDVLSVVAQEVEIIIRIKGGFVPRRVLGREASIKGSEVRINLNQIYSAQEKYVVVELDVPAGMKDGSVDVADVELNYRGMRSNERAGTATKVSARFTQSETEATNSVDKRVMEGVATQVANEIHARAIKLRDQGKVKEARQMLQENAGYLRQQSEAYGSAALGSLSESVEKDAAAIVSDQQWNATRKSMKAREHKLKTQQKY